MIKVQFLDGRVEKFIDSLEKETIARVLRTIDLLQNFGPALGPPHSKKIESHLFELRVRGRQDVRILYAFHGGVAMLVHGFVKKSQRIPSKEIKIARHRLKTLDHI